MNTLIDRDGKVNALIHFDFVTNFNSDVSNTQLCSKRAAHQFN